MQRNSSYRVYVPMHFLNYEALWWKTVNCPVDLVTSSTNQLCRADSLKRTRRRQVQVTARDNITGALIDLISAFCTSCSGGFFGYRNGSKAATFLLLLVLWHDTQSQWVLWGASCLEKLGFIFADPHSIAKATG